MYSGEYDACDVTLSVDILYTQSNITSIISDMFKMLDSAYETGLKHLKSENSTQKSSKFRETIRTIQRDAIGTCFENTLNISFPAFSNIS